MVDEVNFLTPQNVRTIWENEAYDFTKWLKEHINQDGVSEFEDTLDLDIEVTDRERNVGRYNLDLLAQEIEGNRQIVIENQLERSDHDHLGKLIAYWAGVGADVVIWIAPEFNDEHKDALQQLNESTNNDVDFFGIRLEVWRIGDSEPAVRFNPVVEPSEWQKKVSRSDRELTETKKQQLQFWQNFQERIDESDTSLRPRKPQAQSWYNNPVGRNGFTLQFQINSREDRLYTTFLIRDDYEAFEQIKENQEAIEDRVGELEWISHEETRAEKERCKITASREASLEEEDEWSEYIDWLMNKGEEFRRVFEKELSRLEDSR